MKKLSKSPGDNNNPFVLHGNIEPIIDTVNGLIDYVKELEKEIESLRELVNNMKS